MTISIDQAIKLYELGIRRPADKNWMHRPDGVDIIIHNERSITPLELIPNCYPAYDIGELIILLGTEVTDGLTLTCTSDGKWYCSDHFVRYQYKPNPTEALCDKLIHDIQRNII